MPIPGGLTGNVTRMSSCNSQSEGRVANIGRENRIALVIGNAEYRNTRRLKNAQADAAAIASALANACFRSYKKAEYGTLSPLSVVENACLIDMNRLLSDFSA